MKCSLKLMVVMLLLFSLSSILFADKFGTEIDGALNGKSTIQHTKFKPIKVQVSFSEIFKKPYFQKQLLLVVLIGSLLSLLGVFVALKKELFMTLTVAQSAAAGIALGLLLGVHGVAIYVFSAAFIAFCLLLISLYKEKGVADKGALLAVLYLFFSALAVLLLSKAAQGETHITYMLFGDLTTLTVEKALPFLAILIVVIAIHLFFQRLYVPVIFDRNFAEFEQIKVRSVEFVFHLLQGLVLAYAISLTGLFFALAFMAILPTAVLIFARSLRKSFVCAMLWGGGIIVPSFVLAVLTDLPPAAALSMGAVLFYGGVYLLKR